MADSRSCLSSRFARTQADRGLRLLPTALVLGLACRPAAFAMACTMVVAATMHLKTGDGLSGAAHAIESGVALLGLTFTGAGRFSLDRRLRG